MINEREIKGLINVVQTSDKTDERKEAIVIIQKRLKPFRFSLAKRFANKGVDFEDIIQQIELKFIEAVYDYDEAKDPSAVRHITSKTRNGIWNYYRKEMNYFKKDRKFISIDEFDLGIEDGRDFCYDNADNDTWNEDAIIAKLIIEEELGKLTPHQKEILLMYYIDDKTQYNIAEELKINQANVSRATKRAIKQLRFNLSDDKSDKLHSGD